MKTIVFDIKGDWGHFRKPYAPVSPVTFPFPPPPTALGMIGAICGYGKDEYAERIGWDRVKIAVSLKSPVKRYRTALNLVNTKSNKFFPACWGGFSLADSLRIFEVPCLSNLCRRGL